MCFAVNVLRYGYVPNDACVRNVISTLALAYLRGTPQSQPKERKSGMKESNICTLWKVDNMMHMFRTNEMAWHARHTIDFWCCTLNWGPRGDASKRKRDNQPNYTIVHIVFILFRFQSSSLSLCLFFAAVRPPSLRCARKYNQICLPPKKEERNKKTTTRTTTTPSRLLVCVVLFWFCCVRLFRCISLSLASSELSVCALLCFSTYYSSLVSHNKTTHDGTEYFPNGILHSILLN